VLCKDHFSPSTHFRRLLLDTLHPTAFPVILRSYCQKHWTCWSSELGAWSSHARELVLFGIMGRFSDNLQLSSHRLCLWHGIFSGCTIFFTCFVDARINFFLWLDSQVASLILGYCWTFSLFSVD
jgi:hypothetical protein